LISVVTVPSSSMPVCWGRTLPGERRWWP
jgi:hypothetical protein